MTHTTTTEQVFETYLSVHPVDGEWIVREMGYRPSRGEFDIQIGNPHRRKIDAVRFAKRFAFGMGIKMKDIKIYNLK